jgi:hypothetical protein
VQAGVLASVVRAATLAAAAVAFVLVLAPAADPARSPGPMRYGVSDDTGKFQGCPSAFWDGMREIGYSDNRMSVLWDENAPTTIFDRAFLERGVACANAYGIRVLFAVYPMHAGAIGSDPGRQAAFAAYAALVAQTFPTVKDLILGNEANQPRFWQPQFVNGQPVAGRDYEATLAKAYDAIKAVRPDMNVIGFAISSRGNDMPNATNNISRSPVWFIHDAAQAYRESGRTRPIMDEFAFHPYPNLNTDPYTKPFQWPNAGAANLDRIKQALWDGFHDTAQEIPAEQAGGRTTQTYDAGLPMAVAEVGTQTTVTGHEGAYFGVENITPVDEATQAQYYVDLLEIAACDPSVETLLLFRLIDQPELEKFQSGELYADFARKQSFEAIKAKIASAHGACQGTKAAWVHTEQVVGAAADFGDLSRPRWIRQRAWNFTATATEDATYEAQIMNASTKKGVLSANGTIKAYYRPLVQFPRQELPPGSYVYAITMRSVVNPARTSSFTSDPFTVGPAGGPSSANKLPPPNKTNVAPTGTVLVRLPGTNKFVPLKSLKTLPLGTELDVKKGSVKLTANDGSSGQFFGGTFTLHRGTLSKPLSRSLKPKPPRRIFLTSLWLSRENFAVCRKHRGAAKRPPVVGSLWGRGKGRFRTKGRFASAAVRGTYWLVQDRCDGTLVRVRQGVVDVYDIRLRKHVLVRAGKSYLARATK